MSKGTGKLRLRLHEGDYEVYVNGALLATAHLSDIPLMQDALTGEPSPEAIAYLVSFSDSISKADREAANPIVTSTVMTFFGMIDGLRRDDLVRGWARLPRCHFDVSIEGSWDVPDDRPPDEPAPDPDPDPAPGATVPASRPLVTA